MKIWILEGAWGKGKVTQFGDELQKFAEHQWCWDHVELPGKTVRFKTVFQENSTFVT